MISALCTSIFIVQGAITSPNRIFPYLFGRAAPWLIYKLGELKKSNSFAELDIYFQTPAVFNMSLSSQATFKKH